MKFPLVESNGVDQSECDLRWTEKWLAVDLDGTLITYDGFKGEDHFGDIIQPIADAMHERHLNGWRIAIFTARARTVKQSLLVKEYLDNCGIGYDLITNIKKPYFKEFWDDRAVPIERNSGIISQQILTPATAMGRQIGGEHYKKYAIQPLEFIYRNNVPNAEATVLKYILRHRDKNGIEDLKKAIHVLQMLAQLEYGIEL